MTPARQIYLTGRHLVGSYATFLGDTVARVLSVVCLTGLHGTCLWSYRGWELCFFMEQEHCFRELAIYRDVEMATVLHDIFRLFWVTQP